MNVKEIVETWAKEADAANDCIIEILESYMEILGLFEETLKFKNRLNWDTYLELVKGVIKNAREEWLPILNTAKQIKMEAKNEK